VDLLEAMLNSAAADASRLHVSPTRVGGILIEWDDPATQHENEINPDCSIAFLHLNKKTGQIDTRKFSSDSTALLHELRLLLAA
jgi:hypothetical protein